MEWLDANTMFRIGFTVMIGIITIVGMIFTIRKEFDDDGDDY